MGMTPLRVRLVSCDTGRTGYLFKPPYREVWERFGIRFVESNPDANYANWRDALPPRVYREAPTIVEDMDDATGIGGLKAYLLGMDNVRLYLKQTIHRGLRPESYHQVDDVIRIERQLCGLEPFAPTNLRVTERELSKVRLAYPLGRLHHWPVGRDVPPLEDRELDVCAVLVVTYTGQPEPYRRMYLQKLSEVHCNHLLDGRPIDDRVEASVYWQRMYNAKIGPSPWGWAAWCWRDYEVILGGSVLLKPDSQFMEAWPDLYDPNDFWMVPHNHDCSDLAEKIDEIRMHLPKYQVRVTEARRRLIEALEPTCVVARLSRIMREAF